MFFSALSSGIIGFIKDAKSEETLLFLRAQRIRIEDVTLLEVIVVFKAQVGDLRFPHEKTQRVLQLH
jgi:hypothetical protein